MTIRVKFFAMLREKVGQEEILLQLPDNATTETFWQVMVKKYPQLVAYRKQSRLAVNRTYILQEQHLNEGDEVTIIPPVSGG